MKEVVTSYIKNQEKLEKDGYTLVCVCLCKVPGFNGLYEFGFSPSKSVTLCLDFESWEDDIKQKFNEISYNKLPDKCALVCVEKPGDFCHRRIVAEVIQDQIGIEVKEYGKEEYPTAKELFYNRKEWE